LNNGQLAVFSNFALSEFDKDDDGKLNKEEFLDAFASLEKYFENNL
jgi:Ca2+-binding EF-hand superfamily protein